MPTLTPRRSMLYMPGSNARAMEKAATLNADSLILDLEDAVSPDAKAEARELVKQAVSQHDYQNREVLVRINGRDTSWESDDIKAIARLNIDGIVIPKVENPDELLETITEINAISGSTPAIWIMTESARGVLDADQVYGCSTQIRGVILGTSDLSKELRIPHTHDRNGFLHLLSHCVVAARAHGLEIIDGVHLNFGDLDEFSAHCRQGRDLGFDGKSLIHPKQITPCNDIFSPTEEAINIASEIVESWEEAIKSGQGVCVVRGRLIENLHVEEAQRTIALADSIKSAAKTD